jgi:hypothetical protein
VGLGTPIIFVNLTLVSCWVFSLDYPVFTNKLKGKATGKLKT